MIAAIGTGNIRPGVVTASLGTSGTLFAFSAVPIIDPKRRFATAPITGCLSFAR
jgi:sugar (pentulose or hexulose) kinase